MFRYVNSTRGDICKPWTTRTLGDPKRYIFLLVLTGNFPPFFTGKRGCGVRVTCSQRDLTRLWQWRSNRLRGCVGRIQVNFSEHRFHSVIHNTDSSHSPVLRSNMDIVRPTDSLPTSTCSYTIRLCVDDFLLIS